MITTCPICIVEKHVEVRTAVGEARVDATGQIEQLVNFDRMPFAVWMTLTKPEMHYVTHCYCPQCGLVFYHPELFKPENHPLG